MIRAKGNRRNDKAISLVASNIRKYRKAENLTIKQLADRLDVDYSQISRMERGVVNPNISIIFDIAVLLNIPAYKLLTSPDTEQSQ